MLSISARLTLAVSGAEAPSSAEMPLVVRPSSVSGTVAAPGLTGGALLVCLSGVPHRRQKRASAAEGVPQLGHGRGIATSYFCEGWTGALWRRGDCGLGLRAARSRTTTVPATRS